MKIGDKVKIHINRRWDKEAGNFFDGKSGIIKSIRSGSEWPYMVEILGRNETIWDESELELIDGA